MGMRLLLAGAVLAGTTLPVPALDAWGFDVHRRITARALDGLPASARTFFDADRSFVIEHSVDPDLWRVVDLRGRLGDEPPNHFLDIDDLGEPAPYTNVPRDWDAFVARYGEAEAHRAGRLPWRTADVFDRLVDALREARAGRAPWAAANARFLAAVLAHYVSDGFVPFHAVRNYDGQLTGQRGVHARFETVLAGDHRGRLAQRPVVVTPISDMTAFMFDTIVDSAGLAGAVLDADRHAAGTAPGYGAAYYDLFLEQAGPIAERRLSDAADAVASAIATAWIQSGPAAGAAPAP